MTKEYEVILEAKRSLKKQIKFLIKLLKDLNSVDKTLRKKSFIASGCLHRYFNNDLIKDMEKSEKEFFS